MPSAIAGAANGPALPPSKYGGSCAGDTAVVVASDTGAQSDIYSAVTLAGVLDTDCVVLAGARGAAMPAAQSRRLAAAADGGYIVGGAAAVPDCKLAGRTMARLAGADRWATAEAVGAEAKRIADGNPSTPRAIPDRACPASTPTPAPTTGYKAVGVRYDGSACAIRADGRLTCWGPNYDNPDNPTGKYKAISGGDGFTCAIRTDNALACWGTGPATGAPLGKFKAVSAGSSHACAIYTNGNPECWGYDRNGQASPPAGKFKAVAASIDYSCAIRDDDTLTCWGGANLIGEVRGALPPAGKFKAITAEGSSTCAISAGDTLACWGWSIYDAPAGSFKAVAAGRAHACAIRDDDTLVCWGSNAEGQANAPSGRFRAVDAQGNHTCAVRTNGKAICWGVNYRGQSDAPS